MIATPKMEMKPTAAEMLKFVRQEQAQMPPSDSRDDVASKRQPRQA